MIAAAYSAPGQPRGHWAALIPAGTGDVDPKPGPETPLAASDRARGRVPLRILIVEDNVDAAATLRDYLEMDGHQVCIASTGTEGVDAASRFLPHVVLCDIGLPGMNGWDVARSVRAAPATAASRLIAITGYGTDDDRRLSAEAGFEAHLTKPLDMDALEAVLDPRP